MNLYPVSTFLLFLCFLNGSRAATGNPTHVTGDISINCGSRGASAARNGREWLGDVRPKIKSSSLLQIKGSSATSSIIHKLISDGYDPVPYRTARISRSQFSYVFQVNPGQKFIRLYFNPTPYKGFERFKDLFTVEAGAFTLLSNFSASLTANALGVNSFVKEYCISIEESQQFNIIFTPASGQSLQSTYAFINGIEIISVPNGVSLFLQANHEFFDGDGPIKGFEIMKLSNADNSLASPNPLSSARDSSYRLIQLLLRFFGHRNMVATLTELRHVNLVSLIG